MQKSLARVSARARRKVNEPLSSSAAKNGAAWQKPPKPIYALAAYTVEKRGTKWYVIKTSDQGTGRAAWRGPYATLDRATLAIAKLLALEVIERHKRRCDWYGVSL